LNISPAADIQSMALLSKTNILSIGFFTFSQEWDISDTWTLSAAT
jgi:hypothetical protein